MISFDTDRIDYEESGAGPTVVFVPGTCATTSAWRPIVERMDADFRCVTTSLLGYGGTAERRQAANMDMALEAEIVETVIRRAGGRVHLVGHSFGGLVSLAVALRDKVELLSLTVFETVMPEILRIKGERLYYRAIRDMGDAYFSAFREGDPKAIRTMIDFFGGPGTFDGWPQKVREYAMRTTDVNLRDWATAQGFRPGFGALAMLRVPTLVAWGRLSHPAVRRANEILGWSILYATSALVPGASHFLLNTHPDEVVALIRSQIARAEATALEEMHAA